MTSQDTLADIIRRMETSHSCLHPIITEQIPSNALYNLASAMLQIHNSTQDMGSKAIASTAIRALGGET